MIKLSIIFFALIINMAFADIIDDMFSGKKPSTTKCYDFGKPNKVQESGGHKRYRIKKNKNKSKSKYKTQKVQCEIPDLDKQIKETAKEFKEKKKEYLKSLEDVRDQFQEISGYTKRIRSSDGKKTIIKWGTEIISTQQCDKLFAQERKRREKSGEKWLSANKNGGISEQQEFKRDCLLGNLSAKNGATGIKNVEAQLEKINIDLSDLTEHYANYKIETHPRKDSDTKYDKKAYEDFKKTMTLDLNDEAFDGKDKEYEVAQRKMSFIKRLETETMRNSARFKYTDKNGKEKDIFDTSENQYLYNYLIETNPDYAEGLDRLLLLKQEEETLKARAEDLCEEKQPRNMCADMKMEFEKTLNEDPLDLENLKLNFESTLFGIGVLYIDENGEKYPVDISMDNYEEWKEKVKNDKSLQITQTNRDELDKRFDENKKAWKIYQENIANPEKDPKEFESSCADCSLLEKMATKARVNKNQQLQDKLMILSKKVGCKLEKIDLSCREKAKEEFEESYPGSFDEKVLIEDNISNLLGDFKDSKRDDFGRSSKIDQFPELFKSIQSLTDESTKLSCISCDPVKNKISQISDFKDGVYVAKKGVPEDYLNEIKDIGLQLNCIEPPTPKKVKTCKDHQAYFEDFIKTGKNIGDLSALEKDTYDKNITSLREFEEKSGKSCCEEIIKYDTTPSGERVLLSGGVDLEARAQLGEAMQCLDCSSGQDDAKKAQYAQDYAQGAETSCKYYSENIRGKNNLTSSQQDFMDHEVFTCSEGPTQSNLSAGRKWDMLSYSSTGKFGSLVDLDLKCYVNPFPDKNGEYQTVNLSCCNLTPTDPEFIRMQNSLKDHYKNDQISVGDFNKLELGKYRGSGGEKVTKTIDQLNDDLQKGNVNTFCNYVKAGYTAASGVESQQSEIKLCKDYTGKFIYKTQNKNLFNIKTDSYNNADNPKKVDRAD